MSSTRLNKLRNRSKVDTFAPNRYEPLNHRFAEDVEQLGRKRVTRDLNATASARRMDRLWAWGHAA